jgi:hypothetical protein
MTNANPKLKFGYDVSTITEWFQNWIEENIPKYHSVDFEEGTNLVKIYVREALTKEEEEIYLEALEIPKDMPHKFETYIKSNYDKRKNSI